MNGNASKSEDDSVGQSSHQPHTDPPCLRTEALHYLNARINEEELDVYQQHVVEQQGQSAYPIIIFARLIESACDRMKIPYSTGSSMNKLRKMGNGLHILIVDIVLFYGAKSPSEFHPAPTVEITLD